MMMKDAEGNWDTMLEPPFLRTDLFLWLPIRNLAPDLRWERLLNSSRARCTEQSVTFSMMPGVINEALNVTERF
jgi:hypothetical protein